MCAKTSKLWYGIGIAFAVKNIVHYLDIITQKQYYMRFNSSHDLNFATFLNRYTYIYMHMYINGRDRAYEYVECVCVCKR